MTQPLSPATLRARSVNLLSDVLHQGKSLNQIFRTDAVLNLSSNEARFLQEITFGSLRWYIQLAAYVENYLTKPLRKKDNDIFLLLVVGAYQLLHTQQPDHASINNTVKATKLFKKLWAKNLCNAVLRQLQRDRDNNALPTLSLDKQFSHPDWLAKKIQHAWPEHYEHILNANNQRPHTCIRVNTKQISRDEYLQQLNNEDKDGLATAISHTGIRFSRTVNPHQLPNFNTGACSVQDEAGQLCAQLLQPIDNQHVLDACAAPGGKTGHLLETANITLTALDIDEARLTKVEENLQRLSLMNNRVTLKANDACDIDAWWDKCLFDKILLDAPCSAIGVIRRHPDIKLLRRESDINELVKTQQQLLNALWPLLKVGGQLLYTTCSILPEENQQQIRQFLNQEKTAKLKPLDVDWGINTQLGHQLLPAMSDELNSDGFFYAILEKLA